MSIITDPFFRDRVVVVSGATGALGQEVVRCLAERGSRLALVARRPWQVERLKESLSRHGVPADRSLVALVGTEDAEAAAGLVKGVEDALGPIAALLSTAGAFMHASIGEEKGDAARDLLAANFFSVHNLVRAVVPPMKRRRSGSLAFTGARAVLGDPPQGMAIYLAAKAALHAYAEALSRELGPSGLRVAVLAPGELAGDEVRRAAAEGLLAAAAGRLTGGPIHPFPAGG